MRHVRKLSWQCLVAICFAGFAGPAASCEPAPGFELAERPRLQAPSSPLPRAPSVWVESIRRGFIDDDPESCANHAELILGIRAAEHSPTAVYLFEIAEGALPQGVLPDQHIEPIQLGRDVLGFRFSWLDLTAGQSVLAPIGAVVRVTRVSFAGEASEPALVRVIDAGGPPATTEKEWNSMLIWVGLAIALFAAFYLRSPHFKNRNAHDAKLEAIQKRLAAMAKERSANKSED